MSIFNRKRRINRKYEENSKWGDCFTLGGKNIKDMTDIDMLVDDED